MIWLRQTDLIISAREKYYNGYENTDINLKLVFIKIKIENFLKMCKRTDLTMQNNSNGYENHNMNIKMGFIEIEIENSLKY